MRTKTLLLTAALAAVGVTSSMAQVYSVNAVGYINLSVPKGYSIIANQLNASPNNQIATVLGNPSGALTVYAYRTATADFSINNYDPDFQSWDDPAQDVSPGVGLFVFNPSAGAVNLTLVGEVPQGNLSVALKHGYNLVASQVPQSGLLQTDLKFTPSAIGGDTAYRFNNAANNYDIFNYDSDFQSWDVEPSLNVGQGIFIFRGDTAAVQAWSRTFTVN